MVGEGGSEGQGTLKRRGVGKGPTDLAGLNLVRELARGGARVGEERRAVAPAVLVDERDGLVERVDLEANLGTTHASRHEHATPADG